MSAQKTECGGDLPNVILIVTDGQGPWALGCAGNPELRTPNLDRLGGDPADGGASLAGAET